MTSAEKTREKLRILDADLKHAEAKVADLKRIRDAINADLAKHEGGPS